jgi:hypothetical protein
MDKVRSGEAFEGDVRLTVVGERLRVGDHYDAAVDAARAALSS